MTWNSLPPIVLVDTSVLCEILAVPNRSSAPAHHRQQLQDYAEQGATLMLPMATLIETGNHIAQNGNSAEREVVARNFVKLVQQALRSEKPFGVASYPKPETVQRWLDVFPEYASRTERKKKGIGLGDVSILDDYREQCALNRQRVVRIWALDHALVRESRPEERR